ncbi:fungal-specific transcription factor domain-containing protein [Suillus discolor]|uniref:Fungal-specific transcription factor domain-containing protein n=1 Tax=Suillus discolor TaxID=1912936 RepID=A0A9P7FK68_9AGAM|nr:fungal-specific transcription factor domain-containing protein [Suillus discolor]KAG2118968.1 fungal-specific transcription factor domain-containing protein [Suillus discolor]
MNQLSHPWHRPDPSTTFRRYLAAVRPQGQLLAVHHHHASPERMVHHDDFYSMTHQSKKKRIEDDPLPTDAGAKPIQLQRRRVWRACESCRRKKIKCDGCEPTCSQCQSSGSQCTWLQTKDRAALSRHYVQELEARLLHMESLFSQITPVLEQLGPSLNLPGVAGTSIGGSEGFPASTVLQALSSKAVADTRSNVSTPESSSIKVEDDVSESLGQLALDEHGHMRWIGGSSTMSLIQSFRTLTTSPLHRVSPMEEDPRAPGPSVNKLYFPASVFFGKVHALPGPEEVEYPDEDLCDKLVETYFERLHFLMPILDKPSFMPRYKQLMAKRDDIDFIQAEASFISVVFAVFACAAHLVNDPRLTCENPDDGGTGMIYYERALILHYISHASIQVSHVQCFILMSSFLCSVNCLPQAWLLVGQAVRTAQDLGLHRSPRRLAISTTDKETRRKIWWSVYCLDRMLALALGRPLGIEDSDCDVEIPVAVDDENLADYFSGVTLPQKYPSLMTGAIALTTLYQIAGRVLRQVYAIDKCKDVLDQERRSELQGSVEELDEELNKWCDDLPPTFRNEAVTDKHVSMGAVLCSHYYSVLTTLHRNFLPVKRDQPILPKSTARAVSSARSCIRLAPSISNVVPPSHHLAFFIQHLFSSAVIVLLYAMHCTDARAAAAAMDEAKSCLTALESWEGHWPGARKCKELLAELTNTAEEAIRKDNGDTRQAQMMPMPPPVAPAMLERRRSLVSSPGQIPTVNRPIKSKPRKISRSRDPVSTRRPMTSPPYRVESQRNRSTSRKRGHDESEGLAGPSLSYQGAFSTPQPSKPSPHSSPASVNLPSPSMSTLESPQQQEGPNVIPYSYSGPPLSPLHVSSPYDYGMHHSPLVSSSTHQWDSSTVEPRGTDLYPSPSHSNSLPFGNFDPQSNTDTPWYSSDQGYSGLSTTPPTASFAAPGLPFLGLDYIRNYNSHGYSVGGEPDSLWQTFDAGAFGLDPELPFTLGDASSELLAGQHSSP